MFRKVTSVKYDKSLHAILLSLVGWPMGETYTRIMKHFGLTTLSGLEALSLMWVKEPSWLLGILAALGFTAWLGLIIYHGTKILGIDQLPIKAMLITMTGESLVFSVFGILGKNEQLIQNVSGNFVHASGAAFGGLVAGFLIKKYLFSEVPEKEK